MDRQWIENGSKFMKMPNIIDGFSAIKKMEKLDKSLKALNVSTFCKRFHTIIH